jgi:hypothetical protein
MDSVYNVDHVTLHLIARSDDEDSRILAWKLF